MPIAGAGFLLPEWRKHLEIFSCTGLPGGVVRGTQWLQHCILVFGQPSRDWVLLSASNTVMAAAGARGGPRPWGMPRMGSWIVIPGQWLDD